MLTTRTILVAMTAVGLIFIKESWCFTRASNKEWWWSPKQIYKRSFQDAHVCKPEVVNTQWGQFIWKYTGNGIPYAVSENNICWNHTLNDIIIRRCDLKTGNWDPEEVFCMPPISKNHYCPEDLIEITLPESGKFMCAKISDSPLQFNEQFCYGSDAMAYTAPNHLTNAETSSLIQHLRIKNITRYWLPVKRESTDSANKMFTVRLPGRYWGEPFDKSLLVNNTSTVLPGKQCVHAIIRSATFNITFEATDCSNLFHAICVFKKNFVTVSGCPQYFGAISYKPHECYGIDWEYGLFPQDLRPVNISEYITKRNLIQMILREKERKSNRFFMVEYFEENNYYYTIEMNIKEQFHIKADMNDKRPVLSNEILRNRKNVEMTLKMNSEQEELILNVYNRNYVWRIGDDDDNFGIKCFTNADFDLLVKVKLKLLWENELKTKTIFKLMLFDNVPGQYWCTAHTIFNFTEISTSKVVAVRKQKGHVFAMLFDEPSSIIYNSKYPYPESHLKSVSKRIKHVLNDQRQHFEDKHNFKELIIHNIRIMNFEYIISNSTFIRYMCHISVSLKLSSPDKSDDQWSSGEATNGDKLVGTDDNISRRMKEYFILKNLLSLIHPHLKESVKSTEFCFPHTFRMLNGAKNQWNAAPFGQRATTLILCLQKDGLPISRMCESNFLSGAAWAKFPVESEIVCATNTKDRKIVTHDLYALYFSDTLTKEPQIIFESLKKILKTDISNFIAADLYYIAKIVYNGIASFYNADIQIVNTGAAVATAPDNYTTAFMGNIISIFNYLMEVNENIIQSSNLLNSTNILLDAFEGSLDRISAKLNLDGSEVFSLKEDTNTLLDDGVYMDNAFKTIQYKDIGVVVKTAKNFIVLFIDPIRANITGVALFDTDTDVETNEDVSIKLGGEFETFAFRFILANQSIEDLLSQDNLQLATYVPFTLWQRLDEISCRSNYSTTLRPKPKIVIKIYANAKLFQESSAQMNRPVGEKIISVSIPGHDRELPEVLPFIFKIPLDRKMNNSDKASCSYWDYKSWANDGLLYLGESHMDNNLVLCGSTHLTPFAYLVGNGYNLSYALKSDEVLIIKTHAEALDFITILGCSFSLFGTVGIFATAATFQSWRQKASSKVLLQLSTAIALQMILFCFINMEKYSQQLVENEHIVNCLLIGVLLHYFVLVQFFWMLIIAYLQFKRYVQIFGDTRPKRFFFKSSLFGWGIPIIPVLITVLLDRESYVPNEKLAPDSICYPSGESLYFAVLLPITLIICINLVIFIVVSYSIIRGSTRAIRHTEKKLALSQIRLSALLFFLLGFTWIFGLMATMGMGLIFSYLFSLTATLQGFVLFIYFIILDPVTRRMWLTCFQKAFGLENTYNNNNSTSLRTATQIS